MSKQRSAIQCFPTVRVVTTILLITEEPSVTYTPERLNTWGSSILQENPSNTLSSLQSLTFYFSVICTIRFDDFDILVADFSKFKLLLRESLLIKRDKPGEILSRTMKLFLLELFDWDDSFIFILSHDYQDIFWYITLILLCILVELGFV